MESLATRLKIVKQCLKVLKKSIDVFQSKKYDELHEQLRDSVIQRFEFSIDTLWKFLREYLEEKHGVIFAIVSPKEVLRTVLQTKLISADEFEIFEDMINDRNLTSHTYNEFLAEEIAHHIFSYYDLMTAIVKRIKLH